MNNDEITDDEVEKIVEEAKSFKKHYTYVPKRDYVVVWEDGHKEIYDDQDEAFKAWCTKTNNEDNDWMFLYWDAAHSEDMPPVRQECPQIWKDEKVYEGHVMAQWSENSEGELEITAELVEKYISEDVVELPKSEQIVYLESSFSTKDMEGYTDMFMKGATK